MQNRKRFQHFLWNRDLVSLNPLRWPQPLMPRFVDIHCHLLPAIDDGASSREEALAMAEMAVADGIETVIATPHQLGSHAKNTGQGIRAAVAEFQRFLQQSRIPLRVFPGADVRIEPDLTERIRRGEVVTLGDHRRHVLLELPHDVYLPLEPMLRELGSAGLVGILSHPERNRGILAQPGVLRPLVERGCLLQVTAGSLTGSFGSQVQRLAISLVEQRLVHFIATDAHSTRTRAPVLGPAFELVKQMVGENVALDLFSRHPAAVAAGGTVLSGNPKPASHRWGGWFSRTFSSERAAASPIH
jgi:protein-tyrosine phosphatase